MIYRGKERNPSAWKKSPNNAWMVQRDDGNYYLWLRALATERTECAMWRVQVRKREVWLLLLSVIIHTAWLQKSEISPGRIHYILESHLWFLSQVSVYHCKLKFIEQHWGAAKLIYKTVRTSLKTKDMKDMEENIKNSLDDMPIVQIQCWVSFPWTSHHGW